MTQPQFLPGVMPEYKAPNPKDHPFTPYVPGSTKCKWCMFAQTAHPKVARNAELLPDELEKRQGFQTSSVTQCEHEWRAPWFDASTSRYEYIPQMCTLRKGHAGDHRSANSTAANSSER